ncbi:hypothetical protein [Gallaecimonas sp. GXIMD1310]|uniref:hypothetical protein n=1 Tax=Gallaecimonas sp. GXIMD1310 TaxID=3131926 RepID=UPI003246213C
MRVKKAIGLLAIGAVLVLAAASPLHQHLVPCPADQGDTCLAHQEVSWSQWLFGKSASAQLHFLDLLELLTSHSSDSNTPRVQR